jgi:hypothetical protein
VLIISKFSSPSFTGLVQSNHRTPEPFYRIPEKGTRLVGSLHRTSPTRGWLPESSDPDQLLENPTGLVQLIGHVWSVTDFQRLLRPRPASRELCQTCSVCHRTSLVKALPNGSFGVATQKIKALIEIQNLSSSSSLPKIQVLILVLERRFELP